MRKSLGFLAGIVTALQAGVRSCLHDELMLRLDRLEDQRFGHWLPVTAQDAAHGALLPQRNGWSFQIDVTQFDIVLPVDRHEDASQILRAIAHD